MKRTFRLSLATCLVACSLAVSISYSEPAPPSHWEEAIRAFEAADRESPPPQDAVLFIGSSSIRGWHSLADDFPDHPVINRGFGGSTIADSIHFADRIVFPYAPSQIILYAGDNDINAGLSPEEVAKDFKTFAELVHKQLPDTEIGFIAMKPSPNRAHLKEKMRRGNELIAAYTKNDPRLEYIDIFNPMLDEHGEFRTELFVEDQLHLNADGYKLWAKIVHPYLSNAGNEK